MNDQFWSPDTCDCRIKMNTNWNWIESIRFCRLHKSLRGQNHLDIVMAQNRRFNLAHLVDPNEAERNEISEAKIVNKKRIRTENLDNFHEHLPDHHPPSFFTNLRNFLRLNP